jgi:hypothetical protein
MFAMCGVIMAAWSTDGPVVTETMTLYFCRRTKIGYVERKTGRKTHPVEDILVYPANISGYIWIYLQLGERVHSDLVEVRVPVNETATRNCKVKIVGKPVTISDTTKHVLNRRSKYSRLGLVYLDSEVTKKLGRCLRALSRRHDKCHNEGVDAMHIELFGYLAKFNTAVRVN